jgi:transcription initiation factor TFIID TATA-box-binding protein
MIQNVTCTFSFGYKLVLADVLSMLNTNEHILNIRYNPSKFGAIILKFNNVTFLLWSSGRVVCTGAKSVTTAEEVSKQFAKCINKLDDHNDSIILSVIKTFKVQNIMGNEKMDFPLDLYSLLYAKPKNAFYEPELFPGLQFKPSLFESTTVLMFVGGKIVITGVKTEEKYKETKCHIQRLLIKYKRNIPFVHCLLCLCCLIVFIV